MAAWASSETIVIKAGTNVVSTPDGAPSLVRLSGIVEQAAALMLVEKRRVILVTSGAVGCGRSRLRKQAALNRSFRDLRELHRRAVSSTRPYDSACAAAGQLALMSLYETLFSAREVEASQFLVTQQDFDDATRRKNLKYAVDETLEVGMIPIINENDAVSGNAGYELPTNATFSDNDGLAALVARLVGADLLILLSDVDGLYDKPPSSPGARILPRVSPSSLRRSTFDGAVVEFGAKSASGRGGMEAKVAAACRALDWGVKCVALANGADPCVVAKVVRGDDVGTRFVPDADDVVASSNGGRRHAPAVPSEQQQQPEVGQQQQQLVNGGVVGGDALVELLERTRAAAQTLRSLPGERRTALLGAVADALEAHADEILAANAEDVEAAARGEDGEVPAALRQRLGLSQKKLASLAAGARALAAMPDPLGRVALRRELAEGLVLEKRSTSLGVVLVIFEARPDALPQIACLALRAGCGLVLKGGKEARRSCACLRRVIADALDAAAAPPRDDDASPLAGREKLSDAVALVESREDVASILGHPRSAEFVDLVVPRGSNALVRSIQRSTKIPVLGHADGICHVYVDATADAAKAAAIVVDAKTDYPAACNACETVLLHRDVVASSTGGAVVAALRDAGVAVRPGPALLAAMSGGDKQTDLARGLADAEPAETPLSHEYGALEVTVEVVDSVDAAVAFVNKHGSRHTDAIVAEDAAAAQRFLRDVDSACVFHNASTRFADGYRFGLGAELGIATGRIHARGPVGVEGFLTYKWCLASADFHTQHHFAAGDKVYTHRDLDVGGASSSS